MIIIIIKLKNVIVLFELSTFFSSNEPFTYFREAIGIITVPPKLAVKYQN